MAGRGAPLGNKFAAKSKLWENALKRVIAARSGGNLDKGLERYAHKICRMADGKGDGAKWALHEIFNRIDGKHKQSIVGDDEAPPVQVEGCIKLVKSQ